MKIFHLIGSIMLLSVYTGIATAQLFNAETFNEGEQPFGADYSPGVFSVGWSYTPSFAYELLGIETRFAASDGRTVTFQLFDSLPDEPNANLLAEVDFAPLSNLYAGGTFSPVSLDPGTEYFFGFRNVASGIGTNVTGRNGPDTLTNGRFGSGDGQYNAGTLGTLQDPIVRFQTSSVPEPSSLPLLVAGCAIFHANRRRRSVSNNYCG